MSNDGFNDDFKDSFDDQPAAKSGMSTTVKVLLGLLVGGGLLAILCCGGVIWWGMNSVQMVETPAEVDTMRGEIVDIAIPPTFTGKMGFKFEMFGVGMKMVAYEGATSDSVLMIMETKQPGGATPEQQFDQFEAQMDNQGQGDEFKMSELTDSESETRTLTVLGQPAEFKFTKGKSESDGKELRQVTGAISKNGGAVIIMLQLPEEEYNDDEVVKMIESMK